jgi:signal transduction histidine kinase
MKSFLERIKTIVMYYSTILRILKKTARFTIVLIIMLTICKTLVSAAEPSMIFSILLFPGSIRPGSSVLNRKSSNAATGRKAHRKYHRNLTHKVKEFFASFPTAVELYNDRQLLVWMNAVAKEKWKKGKDYTTAQPLIQKKTQNEASSFLNSIEAAYRGEVKVYKGPDYHKISEANNSDSEVIEVFMSPVYEEDLKICGVLLIYLNPGIQDVAKYVYRNEHLQARSFLSNISHEFRTPLNWMLGFSELIDKETDITKIKEYNKNIQNGGKVLLALIDRLIEMSYLIRNETILEKQEFQLSKIISEAYSIISNEVKVLRNKINIQVNTSVNYFHENYPVITDQRKLKQVLVYLSHNALKFTESGYIEIGCKELPDNMLLFHVKDTGIGISDDILHYIFEIFRKEVKSSPFLSEGQGLGLSLTKGYVSLMGGNIWVESKSGEGSTFYFTIKNLYNSSSDEHKDEVADEPGWSEKMKNLIDRSFKKVQSFSSDNSI